MTGLFASDPKWHSRVRDQAAHSVSEGCQYERPVHREINRGVSTDNNARNLRTMFRPIKGQIEMVPGRRPVLLGREKVHSCVVRVASFAHVL